MITYDKLPEKHTVAELARTRRGDCHISDGVYWHEIQPVIAERLIDERDERVRIEDAFRQLLGVSNVTIAVAREIARKHGVELAIFGNVFDEPH